jgi:hypothetical protein
MKAFKPQAAQRKPGSAALAGAGWVPASWFAGGCADLTGSRVMNGFLSRPQIDLTPHPN